MNLIVPANTTLSISDVFCQIEQKSTRRKFIDIKEMS